MCKEGLGLGPVLKAFSFGCRFPKMVPYQSHLGNAGERADFQN